MRRFLLIAVPIAIATAVAVWFYFGRRSASPLAVTTFLPRETIFFAHLPDLNRTRDQWHRSDIYQLFSEPAVREFLQASAPQASKRGQADETERDLERLDPTDLFLALISAPGQKSAFVGGFRFHTKQPAAEQIIGKWRERAISRQSSAPPVTTAYRRHALQTFSLPAVAVTTVYAGQSFFASSDVTALKALLDRVDLVAQDRQSILASDEAYRTAIAHMPREYAVMFYLQPRSLIEKLKTFRAALAQQLANDDSALLSQIRSVCGASRFENGKIHDVIFAAVPRQADRELTRASETLGTADTLLYFASLLNKQSLAAIGNAATLAPISGWLSKFLRVAGAHGVSVDDWQAAFDLELAALVDWAPNARWPAPIATLPVKDPARAAKIATSIATAVDEDATWTKAQKNGVTYLSMSPAAGLFAVTPTIAFSERVLIVGLDFGSVEAAIARSDSSPGGLKNSKVYQTATRALPKPTDSFAYIDTAALYSRCDASLRPLLAMSAAFMPAISHYVDPAKLPPAEAVTKHLSPIVASQRYVADGYVAESLGPVTANDAALALSLAIVYSATFGHRTQH